MEFVSRRPARATRSRRSHVRLAWPGTALALFGSSLASAQPVVDGPDAAAAVTSEPAAAAAPAPPPAAPALPSTPATWPLGAVVGVRSLLYAQNPNNPNSFDDLGASGEVNVVLSGQAHRFLKWQAGFLGALGEPGTTSAALLDLVVKLELAGPFNVWIGRMPVPSDRTSLSTEWAIAPWTLPGQYRGFAVMPSTGWRPDPGPRRGPLLRDDGITVWGQIGDGRFKYYTGVFGLSEPAQSPLYSARLALSLLAPEPGFRTSSSYFGSKDVLGLGLGVQHRAGGSRGIATSPTDVLPEPDDFDELNGDILFETGSDVAGVLDLEAAFARMWGRNESAKYQYFLLASYLLPLEVGIGRFQPLFRLQHAERGSGADAADITGIDAQLGYVIDGHNARVSAGYQYTRISGKGQNAILLGVQLLSKGK